MDMIIRKKKSDLVTPETINFTELVKQSNTTLSLNVQSKLIDELNKEFTESQQQWYIANLFMYMNYHPTNDFPINLETVFAMIGFANKGNAMKTIKNNFVEGEDYKRLLFHVEKNSTRGQPTQDIMLNTETFKLLCMLAKTPEGKEIKKYYVKLESIFLKMSQEELKEQEHMLLLERENTVKLLQEKDKCIAQLKEKQFVSILYIGHNPVIKNVHKIGISSHTKTNDILVRQEGHKSSNPQFEYLFTYETPNAKQIEYLIKALLKPFKLQKPEWISITYERMKQVVDFAIMMYDQYHIEESVDNVSEFVSRYRSNRLVNTNKARVIVNRNIYEEYIRENVIYGPQLRVSIELICDDFYEWFKLKFPEQIDMTHMKLLTGNWSTEFKKEISNTVANITGIENVKHLSLSDRKRGIHFSNSSGFIGMELKCMIKKADFFDHTVYERYVQEFITVTGNPRHKVARVEILEDFLVWVKNNNFTCKNKIMCRTAISSVFKDVLIENIETLTGLQIEDVCKINYNGCFVGMTHKKFPFLGHETTKREQQTEIELIKRQIDNWILDTNQTVIAKIFRKTLEQNNSLSITDVKNLQNQKYVDITSNKRKNKWYLVFGKEGDRFFIKPDAMNYVNSLNQN